RSEDIEGAKLAEALGKMVRDDPTLRTKTEPETNQLIISGMGELHLEVSIHKLQRDHGVEVTVGQPRQIRRHQDALRTAVEGDDRGSPPAAGGRGRRRKAGPEQHLLRGRD